MPGGLDSNGIYVYAEDDDLSPFSTLLNKLADSTSDEFTNDRERLDDIEKTGLKFVASASRVLATGTFYTVGASGFAYSKQLDPLNWQNPSVDPNRIKPTLPGFYRITVAYDASTTNGNGVRQLEVFKNTTRIPGAFLSVGDASSNFLNMNGSYVVAMNGSTDYFNVASVIQTGGVNITATITVNIEYLA